jgi:hypothetical protein
MSDTPESEIEITPEMIDAGVAALYASDRRFDADDEIVARIYRAMQSHVIRRDI